MSETRSMTLEAHQSIRTDDLLQAAERLKQKIRNIDIQNLCIDEAYKKTYLIPKISSMDYWLSQKYLQHIAEALTLQASRNCPFKDIALIDHGGGLGFLGFLAKEVGIGTVIYNDIDPKFLDTARQLGTAIGVVHDRFILGGFDELTKSLRDETAQCTLLVSADVIEHIYDIDEFIKMLPLLSDGSIGVVMSSGANYLSPKYMLSIFSVQKQAENRWCKVREDIIRAALPSIRDPDLHLLAKKTRGRMKDEIVAIANDYATTGSLNKIKKPLGDFDPYLTNTCDPHTGWWAEHLLNPLALVKTLKGYGFNSKVVPGIYNDGQSSYLQRSAARTLNSCIKAMKIFSIPIAPFYMITGSRLR